jgi:hypothetical protein
MQEFIKYVNESDKQNSYRIFQDMDGCLTDFLDHFRNFNKEKLSSKEYEEKYGDGSIWPIIDAGGVDYWRTMPWMKDGKELWDYVSKFNPTILSAPSRNPDSKTGKVLWLKENVNLPNYDVQTKAKHGWDGKSKIILNSDKWRYVSGPFDILIDDTPKKINAWKNAGGFGILHISAKDTISQLQQLGLN